MKPKSKLDDCKKIIAAWIFIIQKLPLIFRQSISGYKPMDLPENIRIETERFVFAPLKQEDEADVFATINFPKTADIISFLKWPMTMDQASAICSQSITGVKWKRGFILLGRSKVDASPIGCVGLRLTDNDCNSAEIGCWITEHWQSRGSATEMIKAVIDFAFKPPCNLSRLETYIAPDNVISQQLCKKMGFQVVGKKKLKTAKKNILLCDVLELKNMYV